MLDLHCRGVQQLPMVAQIAVGVLAENEVNDLVEIRFDFAESERAVVCVFGSGLRRRL